MNEEVNYRLVLIDCIPNKFYYENTAFCFVCKKMDACFGYGWVEREGKRMNPLGIPYLKFKKFDVKVADFYYDGLGSVFGCKKIKDNLLSCNYGTTFSLENGKVKFMSGVENLRSVANTICQSFGALEQFACNATICGCDDMFVEIMNNEARYGFYG
jgi:hypothetical protein